MGRLQSVLPLYKVVGPGCGVTTVQDVSHIAQALADCRPLRKLFHLLGLSPKIFNWWFLAEHGACAIHRRTFAPLKSRELPPASKAEIAHVDKIIAEHVKQAASGLK